MPRDSVARNPVQKFYPVGKAATVAGGADPGRGAERFSEGLLCGELAANQRFRVWVFCSRGSLTPVAAPNVSPNVFFSWCPEAEKRIRSRVLRDVAWGPGVETGAGVPGYSGGFAACAVVSYPDFCSRGSLTPVAAPNAFLVWDRMRRGEFGSVF